MRFNDEVLQAITDQKKVQKAKQQAAQLQAQTLKARQDLAEHQADKAEQMLILLGNLTALRSPTLDPEIRLLIPGGEPANLARATIILNDQHLKAELYGEWASRITRNVSLRASPFEGIASSAEEYAASVPPARVLTPAEFIKALGEVN